MTIERFAISSVIFIIIESMSQSQFSKSNKTYCKLILSITRIEPIKAISMHIASAVVDVNG